MKFVKEYPNFGTTSSFIVITPEFMDQSICNFMPVLFVLSGVGARIFEVLS
jgi:hypothetical protein